MVNMAQPIIFARHCYPINVVSQITWRTVFRARYTAVDELSASASLWSCAYGRYSCHEGSHT